MPSTEKKDLPGRLRSASERLMGTVNGSEFSQLLEEAAIELEKHAFGPIARRSVSCADRLPEGDGSSLGYCDGYWDVYTNGQVRDYAKDMRHPVTHWMPLPDAPMPQMEPKEEK